MEVIKDAVRAVGRKPTRTRGRTAPWWNEKCKIKYHELRCARDSPELAAKAKKRFRAAVREAKREHWRKLVENVTTDEQIFKVMRWAKPRLYQEPPPMKVGDDRWVSDPLERAESLRPTLMARFNAADDLQTWEDEQPESIPWDRTLLLDYVTACNIEMGDKVPGSDKITVRLLKACWTVIGELVKDIFQACIDHGHFPTAFRGAEVVFLPKLWRDLATPKEWRPISLLSCLGKE